METDYEMLERLLYGVKTRDLQPSERLRVIGLGMLREAKLGIGVDVDTEKNNLDTYEIARTSKLGRDLLFDEYPNLKLEYQKNSISKNV